MKRTGDLKLMQELNRSLILDAIRKSGPIPRVKIAQVIGVSPTTVTSAVSDLIAEGLVEEVGTGQSTLNGGRKPILIQFCPDKHFLICVSISNSAIVVSEMNLDARIRNKHVYPSIDCLGQAVIDKLLDVLQDFMASCQDVSACLGISVVAPGIIDAERGVIRYNAKLNLEDIAVKQLLEEQFGMRVWLDNDANALVLAESEMGQCEPMDNLLYVTIGDGIGTGLIVNGSVFRGSKGGAGEFGHISIDKSGARCECGNTGCLENYVSWPGIHSRICAAIVRRTPTVISNMVNGDLNKITPTIFRTALEQQDRVALEIADETAGYLAIGLVTLTNIFNPNAIILGGELFQGNKRFLSVIKTYVSQTALSILNDELVIRFTSLGEEDKLIGAAAVALNDVFHFSL